MLVDPFLRAEPKTNTCSTKVEAVEMRKGNQEVTFWETHLKKTQREVNATEQKLLSNG